MDSSIKPGIACINCNDLIDSSYDQIDKYLRNEPNPCPKCGEEVDWWNACLRHLDEDNLMHMPGKGAFAIIGLQSELFRIHLQPYQSNTYKFSDHGVPIDSTILYVNYTTQRGNLVAQESHGNVPKFRRPACNEVHIYPRLANGIKEAAEPSEVVVLVTYIEHSSSGTPDFLMANALSSFVNGSFNDIAIPGSSVCDVLSDQVVKKHFKKAHFKNRRNPNNTYGNRLNTYIPLLSKKLASNQCPQIVLDSVQELKQLRNDMAHTGQTTKKYTIEEKREMMLSVIFFYRYLYLLDTNNI